jgi:hypothetical protein
MTPDEISSQKLASEVADLLSIHAPHLIVSRRYTNREWYVVVRKKPIIDNPKQTKMFEGSTKL